MYMHHTGGLALNKILWTDLWECIAQLQRQCIQYDIDVCVRKTQETCPVTTTGPRARERCISVWKWNCAARVVVAATRVWLRAASVNQGHRRYCYIIIFIGVCGGSGLVSDPNLQLTVAGASTQRSFKSLSDRHENGHTSWLRRVLCSSSFLFDVRRNEYAAECRRPEFWRREIFHVTTRHSVVIVSARSIVFFFFLFGQNFTNYSKKGKKV